MFVCCFCLFWLLGWFLVFVLFCFPLNLLRSMIHTSKIWKVLTVADFECIEQKMSDQNIHGKISYVAFFVFSANINKLFN